jgi:hypothetical protein
MTEGAEGAAVKRVRSSAQFAQIETKTYYSHAGTVKGELEPPNGSLAPKKFEGGGRTGFGDVVLALGGEKAATEA